MRVVELIDQSISAIYATPRHHSQSQRNSQNHSHQTEPLLSTVKSSQVILTNTANSRAVKCRVEYSRAE